MRYRKGLDQSEGLVLCRKSQATSEGSSTVSEPTKLFLGENRLFDTKRDELHFTATGGNVSYAQEAVSANW